MGTHQLQVPPAMVIKKRWFIINVRVHKFWHCKRHAVHIQRPCWVRTLSFKRNVVGFFIHLRHSRACKESNTNYCVPFAINTNGMFCQRTFSSSNNEQNYCTRKHCQNVTDKKTVTVVESSNFLPDILMLKHPPPWRKTFLNTVVVSKLSMSLGKKWGLYTLILAKL